MRFHHLLHHGTDTRSRLVKEDQGRLIHEDGGKLEEFPLAVREHAGRAIGVVGQVEFGKEFKRSVGFPGRCPPTEQPIPGLAASHDDVLEGGQPGQDARLLEGAGEAQAVHAAGIGSRDRSAAHHYPAAVSLFISGDHVEGRRLSRAIRPDQTGDRSLVDIERTAVEGPDPAEGHRCTLHTQQCAHREPPEVTFDTSSEASDVGAPRRSRHNLVTY